jgi:negative regulator of replication initiation
VRTTLNLDNDVLEQVKQYADSRSMALGRAASDLIRRGLAAPVQTRMVNGFPVIVLPPDSPPIDSDLVERLKDELE